MLLNQNKILGGLKSIPLTIINPKVYDSMYDITNKILLDGAKSVIGGVINDGLDLVFSNDSFGNIKKFISQTFINEVLNINGIAEDSLDYYRFRINPNRLNKRSRKIVTQKYTGNGWDVDTRGEELIIYSYNGSSGSLINSQLGYKLMATLLNYTKTNNNYFDTLFDYIVYNPKLSSAYLKMLLFETFWKANNDDMLIVFEDNTYLGKFQSFEWSQDAMNPYQINYSFDFIVYPQFNYNTNTGWITLSDEKKMRKRFQSITTVPLRSYSDILPPKTYTAGTTTITENQILFDVKSADIVSEIDRRIDMAKFYNAKPIGASEILSENVFTQKQFADLINPDTAYMTTNFIDSSLLVQNLVWLDGEIVNVKVALPSLNKRILDKSMVVMGDVANGLASKARFIEVPKGMSANAMDKNISILNANLTGMELDNIDNITPQELATKYNQLSGIDIFEDAITFNLRNNTTDKYSGGGVYMDTEGNVVKPNITNNPAQKL